MFEKSLFEAAAWIAVARIRFAVVNDCTTRILQGEFGTREVDPYWAGMRELDYAAFGMIEPMR